MLPLLLPCYLFRNCLTLIEVIVILSIVDLSLFGTIVTCYLSYRRVVLIRKHCYMLSLQMLDTVVTHYLSHCWVILVWNHYYLSCLSLWARSSVYLCFVILVLIYLSYSRIIVVIVVLSVVEPRAMCAWGIVIVLRECVGIWAHVNKKTPHPWNPVFFDPSSTLLLIHHH